MCLHLYWGGENVRNLIAGEDVEEIKIDVLMLNFSVLSPTTNIFCKIKVQLFGVRTISNF